MAARVVWLVASGQVRPDQVLGLTFTNKAAAELAERIRTALAAVAVRRPPDRRRAGGRRAVRRPRRADGVDLPRLRRPAAARARAAHRRRAAGPAARRRDPLPARRPRAAPGPRAVRRAGQDRRRRSSATWCSWTARWPSTSSTPSSVLALDAALRGRRRRRDPRHATADASCRATATATRRAHVAGRRAAAPRRTGSACSTSATRWRSRRGWRASTPAVGELERERFRVVLLDEYQDTSSRSSGCWPGCSAAATRSPPSATRARRSTAGAVRRWRNIDRFPTTSRAPTASPSRRYPLDAEQPQRRAAARPRQRALRAAARAAPRRRHCSSRAPRRSAPGGSECALHETYADEVGWVCRPASRRWSQAGTDAARRRGAGARAQRLPGVPRRAGRARRAGRGRRPGRPARAARGRRPRRDAVGARRHRPRTRRWSGCSPGRAGGSAPRDLALLGRRAASSSVRRVRRDGRGADDGEPADDGDAAGRRRRTVRPTTSSGCSRRPSPASTRSTSCRCSRRSTTPAARPYSPAARERSPRSSASCASCAVTWASRCSTCCTASCARPGSTSRSPRRRWPSAPGAPTRSARSSTTPRPSPTWTATRACARSSPTCARPTSSTAAWTPRRRRRATA